MKEGRKDIKEREKHPHLWHLLQRKGVFLFFSKERNNERRRERKKERNTLTIGTCCQENEFLVAVLGVLFKRRKEAKKERKKESPAVVATEICCGDEVVSFLLFVPFFFQMKERKKERQKKTLTCGSGCGGAGTSCIWLAGGGACGGWAVLGMELSLWYMRRALLASMEVLELGFFFPCAPCKKKHSCLG